MRGFQPVSECVLQYEVRFNEGFQFVRGGKLPGVGPSNPLTGCLDGNQNRWSVRMMWAAGGGLDIYYYGQQRGSSCGDSARVHGFNFAIGAWHKIMIRVKLNNPGEQDGQIAVTVDGQHGRVVSGLELRGNTNHQNSLIQRFIFNSFFGGSDPSWSPPHEVTANFRSFEVFAT